MMMLWMLSLLGDLDDVAGRDDESAEPTKVAQCPGPGKDMELETLVRFWRHRSG